MSQTYNKVNIKKLLNSKWTAINPENKEKHFVVVAVGYDEYGAISACFIEPVATNRVISINWEELKNRDTWLHGWL